MSKVKIIDELCGTGKSYHAFRMMESHPDKLWIFVTPYLDQIERVKEEVGVPFEAPEAEPTKQEDLKRLLSERKCVVMTHALFMGIDAETVELISEGKYHVVIDEVLEKVAVHSKSNDLIKDVLLLLQLGILEEKEGGRLEWLTERLNAYSEVYELCKREVLFIHNQQLLIKRESSRVYEAASSVLILTYMFDASPMRMWFDANNIKYEYLTVPLRVTTKQRKEQIRELVYIEKPSSAVQALQENGKTLSSTFYKNATDEQLAVIQRANSNMYYRWYDSRGVGEDRAPKILYTTFKAYAGKIAGTGCKDVDFDNPESRFVSKTARASNQFSDRDRILYCVDVFPHVDIKNYLDSLMDDKSKWLDSDRYAISEMVQFVFRSALREGKPVKIYIASERMTRLFKQWLAEDD